MPNVTNTCVARVFLNVAKFPQATFTSTSGEKEGDELDITGNLTLNGVTKPVTLEAADGRATIRGALARGRFEAEGKLS